MKIRSNLKDGEFLILPPDVGQAVLDYLRKNRVGTPKADKSMPPKSKLEEEKGNRSSSELTRSELTSD